MFQTLAMWLVVIAFSGAGLYNVVGTQKNQRDFARWGYPRGWNLLTGGLEIIGAVLIALPATRIAGLALVTVITVAAIITVLRYRDFSHLVPLSAFAVLIAFAAALS
ncbi:DoxX family protein [Martelella alba]|uniref:DoxX-like family protein n=1 Tax=Martelella alba TaxID=2590451 RepID=A0ABY2SD73_9HYPH|nr:DoxX family protein [Martelella alba]TKI02205.1 hypothetical protein FCN80_25635 [Martelella alba]